MRILIIRPGAIGDTLLTFPVIQALKTQWHVSHVTLVGNAAVLPLALAYGIAEDVSNFESAQWSALFSDGSPLLRAQLRDIDAAICWLRDPDGIVERNLRANGIKHIIIAPGRPAEGERMHEVAYLARTVGLTIDLSSYTLSEQERARSDPAPEPFIALHPGSGGAQKCWPISHFATVIRELWQRSIPVLLLAGPADHERTQALLRILPEPAHTTLLDTLIDAPLLTLARRLRNCRGYLGNDAGITHLAAMLSVPTIAIFGYSDPAIWHPIGAYVRVVYEPMLEDVAPDKVLRELATMVGLHR
jgi:heptosyltransferase III